MLEFKEITLADKEWMEPLFRMANYNAEEYNFTFCYIWRKIFRYEAARLGDYLIIRSSRENRPSSYLFPAGSGDIAPVMEALLEEAAREESPLTFHLTLAESRAVLENLYPGQFEFLPLDNYFDYVYDAQSLITLAGKKLHAKRNHINRFKENYPDWSYEPISLDNLPEVLAMNAEWLELNSEYSDKSMEEESRAVAEAIHDFFALGMDGGLIRAGGRVMAFSMGDRLNSDTYLVHIEKAYNEVQGAYAIINQEFAAHNCEGYLYIDREDDSGEEGLRKANQSYRPVFLVEKFAAKKVR
jgi:hypothetical protein